MKRIYRRLRLRLPDGTVKVFYFTSPLVLKRSWELTFPDKPAPTGKRVVRFPKDTIAIDKTARLI